MFCQNDGFQFIGKVERGNYYLLNGAIDGRYKITMRLYIHNSARCGEEWKAIQWKNGGIDGWYQYDRIGKKIDLTGSYLYDKEVRLYVPSSPEDTIDKVTCEMEDFKEIFWNDEDFDLTRMKWKLKGYREAKTVELKILHEPVQDTMFIILERNNAEGKIINISSLIDIPEIDDIETMSYSKVDNDYHLLFKLENNGWREYQEYLGHLTVNEELEIEDFNVFLSYDSWNGEREKLIYDEQRPENGIRKNE
jgi:hypothetical protein